MFTSNNAPASSFIVSRTSSALCLKSVVLLSFCAVFEFGCEDPPPKKPLDARADMNRDMSQGGSGGGGAGGGGAGGSADGSGDQSRDGDGAATGGTGGANVADAKTDMPAADLPPDSLPADGNASIDTGQACSASNPCPSGQVCARFGPPTNPNSCQPNPCGANPLSCDCAYATLCVPRGFGLCEVRDRVRGVLQRGRVAGRPRRAAAGTAPAGAGGTAAQLFQLPPSDDSEGGHHLSAATIALGSQPRHRSRQGEHPD